MENRFIIDWLTFTTKIDSLESIIKNLGLEDLKFETINGFYGYAESLYYCGIRIHFEGFNDDMGICVEMSGLGCRAFEEYNTIGGFHAIFNLIYENNYNITRIDIAYDDFNDILPLPVIADDVRHKHYISKFRDFEIIESFKSKYNAVTINLGSKKSDVMVRLYDKKQEQISKGNVVMSDTWVRCEMQCRNERARAFIMLYNGENLGDLFCGVLLNYHRFVDLDSNSQKYRCKLRKYWSDLINDAVKIKLFTPAKLDYNVSRLEKYVVKQAGGAIDTYIKMFGKEELLDKIMSTPRVENPNYRRLLSEHGLFCDNHDTSNEKQLEFVFKKDTLEQFTFEDLMKEYYEFLNNAKAEKNLAQKTEQPTKQVAITHKTPFEFTLTKENIEQMTFDVDPLNLDALADYYKPFKYTEK